MQLFQSSSGLVSGQDPSRSTVWMDCFCFDVIKKHPQRKYVGLIGCSPVGCRGTLSGFPFTVSCSYAEASAFLFMLSHIKHWLSTALKYTLNFKHCWLYYAKVIPCFVFLGPQPEQPQLCTEGESEKTWTNPNILCIWKSEPVWGAMKPL